MSKPQRAAGPRCFGSGTSAECRHLAPDGSRPGGWRGGSPVWPKPRGKRAALSQEPLPLAAAAASGLALLLACLILSFPAEVAAATNAHAFACTDYTQGLVFLFSQEGKIEWEYQTTSCNDLWVLPNGNVLFNTGHGVREVTRTKQVVFDYQSPSEIYACQRLTNGLTFIGECNRGRLLEVEPSGRIAKELRLLPEGQDGGHLYMRNARRLENGHYLVTHYGEQMVREYNATGKVVANIPAAGGPHSAARLPNGHTVISCGDLPGGSRVFEVDPAGRTVWEVKGDELPGISLKFIAGFHRLPNGNTVIANWLGHGQFGKAPHLIEITPDKRVAWTFGDHQTMRTISSVQILDAKGDVLRGEVIH